MKQQAYWDVLDCKNPQYPDNEEYMRAFRFWTEIADLPEDRWEEYV